MRTRASLLSAPLLCLLVACRSTPDPLPAGDGLVTVDRTPPAGVEAVPAPTWHVGDRFVFRKGGLARIAFRIDETVEGVHHLTDEQSGLVTLVTEELAECGQYKPGEPDLTRTFDPPDHVLAWPLWLGKRWSCNYVSRAPGRPDVPLIVNYQCDAVERIETLAGTFDTLRIWREARVAAEGDFVERTSILWYAPEVGVIVRRLADGMVTELEEVHRQ